MQRISWKKAPAKHQPRRLGGRVVAAYRHSSGAMLTHWTPLSRHAAMAERVGAWLLEHDGQPIVMRRYYNRPMRKPPLRWATTMLRGHLGSRYTSTCGGHPPYASKPCVKHLPIHAMEGPRAMPPLAVAGPAEPLPADPARPAPPMGFPARPKGKLVTDKFAHQILFCDEYDLYVDTWDRWVADHPEYLTPEHRTDLMAICMETVLQFRLLELIKTGFCRRFVRMYYSSCLRMQEARVRLGATRRIRLKAAGLL